MHDATAQRSAPERRWGDLPAWATRALFAALICVQIGFAFQGIANYWQWGHNGYNGAAYQLAARNTLRWGLLLPAQYAAGDRLPDPHELYTHAPLALHLHTTASVWLFGDSELSVRLVPALFGILAAAALFAVARRHWSDSHALLALGIYVLLPINQGFANMTNHSTGCIFWSLLMLAAWLRWVERRDPWAMAGLFAASFMAMNWDWPAYYIAFAVAVHGFYHALDPLRADADPRRQRRDLLLLGIFCLWVLANFFGFFWLVSTLVGSFDEIGRSFTARHATPPDAYKRLWTQTLEPMFSTGLALASVAWVFGFIVRHAQRRHRPADLIILAFFFAGTLHLLLFKSTALIHIYWVWQYNPFVALAGAATLLWLVRAPTDLLAPLLAPTAPRRAALTALCAAAILAPFGAAYLTHALPLIPEARRLAGTYNFPKYDSGYLKVLFAHKVNAWTTFDTGVMVHSDLKHRVEFFAPLDRVRGTAHRVDRLTPPRHVPAKAGWVLIAPVKGTPRDQIVRAASRHPYYQYGLYFMVDYRKEGQDIQIWNLRSEPPTAAWSFFVNAFEPPMIAVRDPISERRLAAEVEALSAPRPPRLDPHLPHRSPP